MTSMCSTTANTMQAGTRWAPELRKYRAARSATLFRPPIWLLPERRFTHTLPRTHSNDAPFSAAAISADPIRGYVYIASYIKNEDTGYPDYKANGYLNVYDLNGKLVKTCPTGVGPTAIIQNTTVVYE